MKAIIASIVAVLTLFMPVFVVANNSAILYAAPASDSVSVGDIMSVTVYIKSTEEPMNAVEGAVAYDTNFFDLIDIDKRGSVISLWVQDPANSSGSTISFAGTALNPGYMGIGGKVFTLNLRAKQVGSGAITTTNAKILANDGLGTDITAGHSGAVVAVVSRPEPLPDPVPEPVIESVPNDTTPGASTEQGGSASGDVIAIKTQELLDVLLKSQLPEEQAEALLDRIPDEILQRDTTVRTMVVEKEKEVQKYKTITQVATAANTVTLVVTAFSWVRVFQLKRVLGVLKSGAKILR